MSSCPQRLAPYVKVVDIWLALHMVDSETGILR